MANGGGEALCPSVRRGPGGRAAFPPPTEKLKELLELRLGAAEETRRRGDGGRGVRRSDVSGATDPRGLRKPGRARRQRRDGALLFSGVATHAPTSTWPLAKLHFTGTILA